MIQLNYLLKPAKLQKLEDWRENEIPGENQEENKIKKSKLAFWL